VKIQLIQTPTRQDEGLNFFLHAIFTHSSDLKKKEASILLRVTLV